MTENLFLTDIARKHNPNVERVFFCGLPGNTAAYVKRLNGSGRFRIVIDEGKLPCVTKRLFALFHELGHVANGHPDMLHLLRHTAMHVLFEKEADEWAFRQMNMVDQVCHKCIVEGANGCSRGFVL